MDESIDLDIDNVEDGETKIKADKQPDVKWKISLCWILNSKWN